MPSPDPLGLLAGSALDVAPLLLGATLRVESPEGAVAVRLTEVEAYLGIGEDPGSHAHRREGPKNQVMFGPPGRLYAYRTYGLHTCVNVVTSPAGTASAVLLRAGEIIEGEALARHRRAWTGGAAQLARGPARLAVALGLTMADNGADLQSSRVRLTLAAPVPFVSGPRTGVSGPGGSDEYPWRFWRPEDPTVLPYKPHGDHRR
jgi:DNA-3-methyladenine glycosylase